MASKVEQRKIQIIADGSQVNSSFNQMAATVKILQNQLKKLPPDTQAFTDKQKELDKVRGRFNEIKGEVFGTESAMSKMTKTLGPLAAGLGIAFGVNTVVNFFKSSSGAAKDFEKALSSLASITGASGADLEFYSEQAALIGQTTTLSASQAVEAFMLMGSARPELLKNKEALAAVTMEAVTLAEAAGIELPAATQALAGAMNQFQLPAEDASRVINALAAGSKEGAANIPEISQAIDKFGVAASAFNVTFEESVGLVETLAEFNIKGAESGTALRNVLASMASARALPRKALEELEKFGVDLDVVSDKTIPMNERLAEFAKISGDATALTKVFGKENMIAGQIVLQNVDKFEQYSSAVTGTNTAVEQAAINTNNLDGDFKSLSSVIESIKIGFGEFLNQGLRPLVQGFIQFLLILKEAPKFVSENRELFYALGLAIVALNIANIKATASAIAATAAEKGRAIATQASAIAQRVLNAAMNANPIGIIITLVGGLILVLMNLYRTNENVRGAINGLWSAAKAAFEGIRDSAKSILGGVGDLLLGIFTFDPEKIKAGWSALTSAASEIGENTVNAFKDSYQSTLQKANEEIAGEHQTGADQIIAIEEDKNESLSELEEESAKERKEKAKKAAEERKKLLEDFAKAELESIKTMEDLELSLMEEGSQKKLAKAELDHQRALRQLETQRTAILENTAITEEQKAAMLETYRLEAEARDQELAQKKADIEEEERKKKLDKDLEVLTEEEQIISEHIEQQFMNAINADWERNEARLRMEREFVARRLAILEESGKGETAQAEKLRTALLRIDKDLTDGKIAEAQRYEDFKFGIQQMGFEAARNFMQLGLELLNEESKARKVLATAMKAIEIGQIISQGIREVQAIWAGAATLGPIVGPIVGAAQTAVAVSRSALAINKIRTTQYATGGQTGSGKAIDMMMGRDGVWRMPDGQGTSNIGSFAKGGHIGSASFGVIGEKGSEWVGPNWMLRSPKYANIFGYLEAERRRATPFAMGGSTQQGQPQIPQNTSATADLQQFMRMIEQFGQMQEVMEQIRDIVEEWPMKLRVVNDPRDIIDGVRVLNEIESDSRINR